MPDFFKGLNYKNKTAYDLFAALKLLNQNSLRYNIACKYIKPDESVIDICAGTGELKRFLPKGCNYVCIEKSPQFQAELKKQGIEYFDINLHKGLAAFGHNFDTLVMIISLCHFRPTSAYSLLEDFKRIAKKVIIVEEVLQKARNADCLRQRMMDYLCAVDYYIPASLFTALEFEEMMRVHKYIYNRYNKRYAIGYYERV